MLRSLLVSVLAAALAFVVLPGAPASASTAAAAVDATRAPHGCRPAPVRVMFVGDSITAGRSGDTSYRYWVWRQLRAARVPARFVGPLTARRGGNVYRRSDHGFQKRHAAKGGTTYREHLPRVRGLVRTLRPDVVVLGLGFNDAWISTPEQTIARAREYLDRVWEVDPDVRVVLNQVTWASRPGEARRNPWRKRYNELLAELAEDEARAYLSRIVDGPGVRWNPFAHTFDGVHPDELGERVVARHVADALAEARVLPRGSGASAQRPVCGA